MVLLRQQEGTVRAKLCDAVLPLPKAIEHFALMVKETAQMLQSFGTELAETELPNDVQSTSSVLCAHTEKKVKAKVRAASVGRWGVGRIPVGEKELLSALGKTELKRFQRCLLMLMSWVTSVMRSKTCSFLKAV